jgi:hypothetical protein
MLLRGTICAGSVLLDETTGQGVDVPVGWDGCRGHVVGRLQLALWQLVHETGLAVLLSIA